MAGSDGAGGAPGLGGGGEAEMQGLLWAEGKGVALDTGSDIFVSHGCCRGSQSPGCKG